MTLSFDFITGFSLGVEIITGNELEEDFNWLFVLHLGICRIGILKENV